MDAESMAMDTPKLAIPAWVNRIAQYQSMYVPIAFMGMLAVVVVPLPPMVMDVLIAANLALASLVLLTTLFITSPLELSVFPSLLLATTLFRLVLNIATTRLILSADTDSPEQATAVAGKVIEAFSIFVSGNSLVVGMILFIILIIVQFVVITKGSTRISEVAARFTLDAMPGKQMAIDADLNAGILDEATARKRREEIAQEADFYGAMDGAAKFVRGDAIAGIIITLINILGGFAVGVLEKGWSLTDSLEVFTRLTIGDGLVSQLPSFVISIAAGLIVTRSSTKLDLGTELTTQLISRWEALAITAGFLIFMAFTGLPALPLLFLASVLGGLAWLNRQKGIDKQQAQEQVEATQQEQPKTEEATIEQMLAVDTLELEVGYALVRMVDVNQGGDLLDRISMIRRQLAGDLGLVMPPVRIRDNMQFQPNDYHIKIRGNSVATGSVYPEQFLAMDSGLSSTALEGIKTIEPAFGLEATWIAAGQKDRAESLNFTVVDAASVLATHLTEVVKNFAAELITREETNNLVTQLKTRAPKLVDEVIGDEGKIIKPGELQKIIQNLLAERVSVRDMETVVETLGDWAPRTKDLEVLTEYVRNALRRSICNQYVEQPLGDELADVAKPAPKLYCVSLDPVLEDQINSYIDRTAEGTTMTMPPVVANKVVTAMVQELQTLIQAGHQPVVLASPQVRAAVRRLIEPHLPNAAVLGYNEIEKGIDVESVGLVQMPVETMGATLQGAGN